MILLDARNDVFRRADWAPTQSDDAKTVLNGFFNDVLKELAVNAPFGLLETEVTINTQAPVKPVSVADTLSISDNNDPWVVKRNIARSNPAITAVTQYWPNDRSRDGAELLVQVEADRWVRHRIRHVWVAAPDTEMMTLFEPQDGGLFSLPAPGTYTARNWYIHSPILWLPGDLIEIKSVRVEGTQSADSVLRPLPPHTAERLMFKSTPDVVSVGEPEHWFLWGTQKLDAPRKAPAVVLDASAGTWLDNELDPPGRFVYAYTWCWGLRSSPLAHPGPDVGSAIRRVPLWESDLSPMSSEINVIGGGNGVKITVPGIERIQGFGDTGTDRYQKSGWFVRLYRRRNTTPSAGAFIEEPDSFQLIAVGGEDTLTFTDGGIRQADYFTRPPIHGGYFGLGLWPRPDDIYPLTIRYIRQPAMLVDDYDTLPVQPHFESIVRELVLARVLEMRADAGNGVLARQRAMNAIAEARQSMSARSVPAGTVMHKIPARGRRAWWRGIPF